MRKRVTLSLSLVLVIALIIVFSPYYGSKKGTKLDKGVKMTLAIFGKMDEREEQKQEDSHLILLLKNISQALDGWLKSINERIESEEVTKIEVRFLEILRSILEWIKEKIDSKIESSRPPVRQTQSFWFFRA